MRQLYKNEIKVHPLLVSDRLSASLLRLVLTPETYLLPCSYQLLPEHPQGHPR